MHIYSYSKPYVYLIILLFILLINTNNTSFAQVYSSDPTIHNFDRNTFVSVDEIFNEFRALQRFDNPESNEVEEFSNHLNLTRHIFGYTLIAKYLGEVHQIPPKKKQAFDLSIDLLNLDAQFKELVNHEVFVEIDNYKLWVPIQNNLREIWQENVSLNDSVLIYIRIVGGYNSNPENRWLFTITGFHESLQTALWNEGIENLQIGKDIVGKRYLNKLIKLFPNDAEAHATLAYHHTENGINATKEIQENNFEKADSLFQIAEKVAPDYGFQYFQKAILRYHQERYIDSWDLIQKAKKNGHMEIENKFLEELSSKMSFEEYKTHID